MSPPGAGYDCYRTYELLLLGVIPIVENRPITSELFTDLPVIKMENMFDNTTTAKKYVDAVRNYIESEAFQNGTFTGWSRLFLEYWRRKVLKDAMGRDRAIIKDEEGKEYYQAWHYTPNNSNKLTVCSKAGNCEV